MLTSPQFYGSVTRMLVFQTWLLGLSFLVPWVILAAGVLRVCQGPSFILGPLAVVLAGASLYASMQVPLLWPMASFALGPVLAVLVLVLSPNLRRDIFLFVRLPAFGLTLILLGGVLFVLGPVMFPFVGVLFPQTACDTSLGHLTLPLSVIENGGWVNSWWVRNPWTPQLLHSVFAGVAQWGMNFSGRGDLLPGFLQLCFWASLIGVVFVRLRYWSFLFAILVLTIPIVLFQSSMAYLDFLTIVMFVVLTTTLLTWIESQRHELLLWAVFLAVVSYLIKHQGGLFATIPFGLTLLLAFPQLKKGIFSLPRSRWILTLSICFAFFLLFTFRNIQLAKNPFFPFGPWFENSFFWDRESLQGFANAVSFYKPKDWWGFVSGFWVVGFDTNPHSDTGLFGFGWWWWFLFATFLVLRGFAFWGRMSSAQVLKVNWGLGLLIGFTSLWLLTTPVNRYLTPVSVVALLILCELVLTLTERWKRTLSWLVLILVGWFSLEPLVRISFTRPPPQTREEVIQFIRQNVVAGALWETMDQKLPPQSAVLGVLLSCHHLYSPRPIVGDWFGAGGTHHFFGKSKEQIRAFVSDFQFDAVIAQSNHFNWTPEKIFGDYFSCLTPIQESAGYTLYQVSRDTECFTASSEKTVRNQLRETKGFQLTPFWSTSKKEKF